MKEPLLREATSGKYLGAARIVVATARFRLTVKEAFVAMQDDKDNDGRSG